MTVEPDRVVRFHYTLFDEQGASMESSRAGEPLAVLHGHGNVIAGVEDALQGRAAGDTFSVQVPPDKAYGERLPGRTQRVPKKHIAGAKRLKPGDETVIATREGHRSVTVLKVGHSVVDVDLNHPLAGRALRFDIEIVEVRAAEAEELAHGHVHGPGGHGH
jgi:FKBP-type peptidyl-prolyl cis-trans isomerase SlyD